MLTHHPSPKHAALEAICGCHHPQAKGSRARYSPLRRAALQQQELLRLGMDWAFMSTVSGRYSSSSVSFLSALRAMHWKAASTFTSSFALVS